MGRGDGKVRLAFLSNFTQVPNAGLGKELSLAASGLYARIIRLAGIPNVELTKEFIRNNCKEKEKSFEGVWLELKSRGYIVQYLQPKAQGRGWYQEYEILGKPRLDGVHTVYRDKDGNETGKTNLTRDRQPPDRYPLYGIYGNGIYGKGGNNIINNKYINNIYNNKYNNISKTNVRSKNKTNTHSNNQFNQFPQRDYDFEQLEIDLLSAQQRVDKSGGEDEDGD